MQSFNNNKLRGRIVELYGTQARFCTDSGISPDVVSLKLANKSRMTREDIESWADSLKIKPDEYHVYFFAHDDVNSQ